MTNVNRASSSHSRGGSSTSDAPSTGTPIQTTQPTRGELRSTSTPLSGRRSNKAGLAPRGAVPRSRSGGTPPNNQTATSASHHRPAGSHSRTPGHNPPGLPSGSSAGGAGGQPPRRPSATQASSSHQSSAARQAKISRLEARIHAASTELRQLESTDRANARIHALLTSAERQLMRAEFRLRALRGMRADMQRSNNPTITFPHDAHGNIIHPRRHRDGVDGFVRSTHDLTTQAHDIEGQIAGQQQVVSDAERNLARREEQAGAIIPIDTSRLNELRNTINYAQDQLNALKS